MKKPFPKFDSDEKLEAFLDAADLDEYDLTAGRFRASEKALRPLARQADLVDGKNNKTNGAAPDGCGAILRGREAEEAGLPILELQSVSKHFGAIHALNEVDLTLDSGEVLGLMGDNGAGKSTLVKVIAGNFPPTHGEVAHRRRGGAFS